MNPNGNHPNRKRLEREATKSRFTRTVATVGVLLILVAALKVANVVLPGKTDSHKHVPRVSTEPLPAMGFVKEVVDGDTLILKSGHCIRLKGIDTPEYGQHGHDEATETLRSLVTGKELAFSVDDREAQDRYDRWLAYISTPSCDSVNEELIASGRAWIYRLAQDAPQRFRMVELQRQAIEARKGIWAKLNGDEEGPFRGSRSSHIFHKPDCANGRRISDRNLQEFELLREAFQQGYSPCRKCFTHPLKGR